MNLLLFVTKSLHTFCIWHSICFKFLLNNILQVVAVLLIADVIMLIFSDNSYILLPWISIWNSICIIYRICGGEKNIGASVLPFGWGTHGWCSRRHQASLIDRPRCSRKLTRKLCFANEIRFRCDDNKRMWNFSIRDYLLLSLCRLETELLKLD